MRFRSRSRYSRRRPMRARRGYPGRRSPVRRGRIRW